MGKKKGPDEGDLNAEDTSNYCPRARLNQEDLVAPVKIEVATDPALNEVVRMVVAGLDRRFDLHPRFKDWVAGSGGQQYAEQLIVQQVSHGGVDCLQTDMDLGGSGLFGARLDNGRAFRFYEWISPRDGQLTVRITPVEARAIVEGAMTEVFFEPVVNRSFGALVDIYVMHCLKSTGENSRRGIVEWVYAKEASNFTAQCNFSPADFELSVKRLLRTGRIEKAREEPLLDSPQKRVRSFYRLTNWGGDSGAVEIDRFRNSIRSVLGLREFPRRKFKI